jgi:predicted ATP-dependent endonuclease of OLD family
MRIDEIRITNFDGFDHRTFTFNPRFTLLAGDNATGKTSVLDALAVAAGSWFLGVGGFETSRGITPEEVRMAAHPHLDSYTFEKQFPSRVECTGVVMGHQIRWAGKRPFPIWNSRQMPVCSPP